jgi:hypothetical protein
MHLSDCVTGDCARRDHDAIEQRDSTRNAPCGKCDHAVIADSTQREQDSTAPASVTGDCDRMTMNAVGDRAAMTGAPR